MDCRLLMMMLMFGTAVPRAGAADSTRFPQRFSLEVDETALSSEDLTGSHLETLGERGGFWGSLEGGFEAWAYPFKLFDSLNLFLLDPSNGTPRNLAEFARQQVAAPHLAQLRFEGPDWELTASFFFPRSVEGGVILFDAVTKRDFELVVRYRPSLAPMMMTEPQELNLEWDEERREQVTRDPERGVELRMGSPGAVGSAGPARGGQTLRLKIPSSLSGRSYVPLRFGAGLPRGRPVQETMDVLESGLPMLVRAAARHYRQLLARAPRVVTPDADVNDALTWSAVSLDQLRIHNPFLGYGLVSGYSSSGTGTRPRYCWFFEEPTLASWAFHRVGLSGHVSEALRFLQRYQREDGKTLHEMSQSLMYQPEFLQTYRYAYMHSDGPVYYLMAYGHYYRSTGDLDFIRAEWNRIRATLEWCFSVMDPADGLMAIDRGDWGSAESSTGVWKDTQLEAMWVRALGEAAALASVMGDDALAARCRETREKALASIEEQFWDEAAGNYIWGISRSGGKLGASVPHHALGFWLSSLDPERVERALQGFAGSDFRADWGVRTLKMSDPKYDGNGYQNGSVWPVWNAGVIVSDYRHGRATEGFRTWRTLVRMRSLQALGPMPEVLNGDRFQRLTEGVPHQMFSEVATVNGFYDGLLGLDVDIPGRHLTLAPTVPPVWDKLTVERIPIGKGQLDLTLERAPDRLRIELNVTVGGPFAVRLAPRLPPGTLPGSVFVDGARVPFQSNATPSYTEILLTLSAVNGRRVVEIWHSGGIEVMPIDLPLERGAASRGLRLIRAGLEDGDWVMTLEGRPEMDYSLQVYTRRVPRRIFDGQITHRTINGFRVELKAPSASATNAAGYARWATSIQFERGR